MSIAPLQAPFEDVQKIAVLRGGGLGDLLFALAAVDALAATYPRASITLLGTPLHRALLEGRPTPIDRVAVLPIARGVRDERGAIEDELQTARFIDEMRAEKFDLAVQLHGGGRYSNPFLLRLGARHTVGLRTPDAAALERDVSYIYYQHEVLRALEVVGLAGAAPIRLEPHVPVTLTEHELAARHRNPAARGLVLLHPGATDPRRRWPADKFAELASRLTADGTQVIIIGDASDEPAAAEILATSSDRGSRTSRALIGSVAGQLSLSELVGLMSHADVVVGNDSGPRHLAQAVGARTVGIYWFGNLINAGPLGRGNHRAHIAWTTVCPVCGRDSTQVGWTAERCEHDVSFVADVAVAGVYEDVAELRATSLLQRGR